MQLPTATPSAHAVEQLRVCGSWAALRGHGQSKRASGGAADGGRSREVGVQPREAPGRGSTAPWGEFLGADGEVSPSPERLCPLVASKGAEAEEVPLLSPPPSAAGVAGPRLSPAEEAAHALAAGVGHGGAGGTPRLPRGTGRLPGTLSPNNLRPRWNGGGGKNPLGRLGGPFSTVLSPAKSTTLS